MAANDMDAFPPNSPHDPPAPGKLVRPVAATTLEPRRILPVTIAPGAPLALSATPDALALLRALKRRWFVALSLGLVAAGLAFAAAWYAVPAKYLATELLRVESKRQSGTDMIQNPMAHSMFMKTTSDRLKSKEILLKALKDDNVRNLGIIRKHPDTVSALMWLEESLKVEYREGSELLNVLLTGDEPQELVRIVGALATGFLQVVNGEEKRQRQSRVDRYGKLLEEAKEKLREKTDQKDQLEKGNKQKNPQTLLAEQAQNRNRLYGAQEALARHQFDMDTKNSTLAVLLQQKAGADKLAPPDYSLQDIYAYDPDLKTDAAKAVKLEDVLKALVRAGHPRDDLTRRQVEQDLGDVKKALEKRVPEVRTEMVAKSRKRYDTELDATILKIRTEMEPLKGYLAKYQKDVDELSKNVDVIDFITAKHTLLESEIAQQQKVVGELYHAAKKAEVEHEGDLPIARIGEAEWQPRDAKKRLLMLLLAPLAALFGVVLAVGWWEFSARRIQGPEEVTAGLAIRVVGAVPELPDPRRVQQGGDPQMQAIYRHNLVESIDAIRTMLLRSAPAENLRTIMVTSAVGGEGKTTLASNLAMSLARAGRKTLLMDCDLRRPSAHQLFEQALQPGFSEVALREVELPDAIRPTTTDPNLFLLPAGHWDREVIHELAKNGITGIFEKLREEYDFIIVDSHPVLPATDSLLLGQHVDAVIVSVMRDLSQVHHVHTACQQLSTLGIRVFGAVVSGVPVKVYGKGYQYAAAQPVA